MGHISCLIESKHTLLFKNFYWSISLTHTHMLPPIRCIWLNTFSQTIYICANSMQLKNHNIRASHMPSWGFLPVTNHSLLLYSPLHTLRGTPILTSNAIDLSCLVFEFYINAITQYVLLFVWLFCSTFCLCVVVGSTMI